MWDVINIKSFPSGLLFGWHMWNGMTNSNLSLFQIWLINLDRFRRLRSQCLHCGLIGFKLPEQFILRVGLTASFGTNVRLLQMPQRCDVELVEYAASKNAIVCWDFGFLTIQFFLQFCNCDFREMFIPDTTTRNSDKKIYQFYVKYGM